MQINIKGEDFGHKPKRENPKPTEPWECDCPDPGPDAFGDAYVWQPPYRKNCPDCWAKRPY